MEQLLLHLNLTHGAIWGVLARKGLIALTTYSGSYLGGVIWANFTACLIIAFFSKYEKTPLIVGITTGFCGTLSSFSSLIVESFELATEIGYNYNYPTKGYGVMQVISVIVGQLAVSIFGFHIGQHLQFKMVTPKYSSHISACMGLVTFIVSVILLGVYGPWREWMFSCLFAPFGAILRYQLSKLNKPFPWGTFMANVIGTTLLAVFTLILMSHSQSSRVISSIIGCQALLGAGDGFCGGLTTVSTFVTELFKLPVREKYRYGLSSIIFCFCIVLVILGSYHWSHGLVSPICQCVNADACNRGLTS